MILIYFTETKYIQTKKNYEVVIKSIIYRYTSPVDNNKHLWFII